VDDHVHFVEEAFREQRTDRAVDQARGQGFMLAGLGFALEEAAGNLAGGVGLLDVVHREREEVLAGLRALGGHDGGQHHRAFDVHDDGAAGLAGDLAGFQDDGVGAPLERLGGFVENAHVDLSLLLFTAHQAALSAWRVGGVEHDAIPENTEVLPRGEQSLRGLWNDTARIRLAVSEVQSA
jgi:hypothetical protein